MTALSRLTATLDRITCGAAVLVFAAIFVTMVLQIGFRYLLNSPLVWTEELARYLYIWACYLGAPIALRRGSHITIALLAERLPPPAARWLALGLHALAVFFLLALLVLGIQLAVRTHSVSAITLPIPWSAIYLAAPVSAALMILQTAEDAWAVWTRRAAPAAA